jgi:hypothetical protein
LLWPRADVRHPGLHAALRRFQRKAVGAGKAPRLWLVVCDGHACENLGNSGTGEDRATPNSMLAKECSCERMGASR